MRNDGVGEGESGSRSLKAQAGDLGSQFRSVGFGSSTPVAVRRAEEDMHLESDSVPGSRRLGGESVLVCLALHDADDVGTWASAGRVSQCQRGTRCIATLA